MNTFIPLLIMVLVMPILMIFWNRNRVKGKMLCFFIRDDKSVLPKLCQLEKNFVKFGHSAYQIYPDFVRLCRFPMGWPAFLQELVPACLYDEKDAVPLDWIYLGERRESSMELRAALDENWVHKIVTETAKDGQTLGINWRKILPFLLLGLGVVGLVAIFMLKGCGGV